MQFKDIIGQQEVKDQLVNMVQQNRLSHALLFLSKEGSGSLSLAIAFAQYLVCTTITGSPLQSPGLFGSHSDEQPSANDASSFHDSCGTCPACKKAADLIHPDVHFSFPVITKKPTEPPVSNDYISQWRQFVNASPYGNVYDWLQFINAENKQGNITARECEEISHIMYLKSFESRRKILVMWMPEFLGKEGNKLLKLVEEPPPDTLFIFVAEDENEILQTILSRTQLIRIPLLSDAAVEQGLMLSGVEANAANQIASVSEGNYREALQVMEHSGEDWQSMLREWLNAIVKGGPVAQVKWIDDISKLGREKQKQFLKYFIHLLEQAIRARVNEKYNLHNISLTQHMLEKDSDFANRLNKICSMEGQEAIAGELNKASWYIERNAHAKMLFHALSIRLHHIIKDNSLILVR